MKTKEEIEKRLKHLHMDLKDMEGLFMTIDYREVVKHEIEILEWVLSNE